MPSPPLSGSGRRASAEQDPRDGLDGLDGLEPAAHATGSGGDGTSHATFVPTVGSDAKSEAFLHAAGLGGSAVYDLQAMEEAIRAELAAADDDDLHDDDDDEFEAWLRGGVAAGGELAKRESVVAARGGSFSGGTAVSLSRASSFSAGGSSFKRSGSSFKRSGSSFASRSGSFRTSCAGGSNGLILTADLSAAGGPGGGGDRRSASSAGAGGGAAGGGRGAFGSFRRTADAVRASGRLSRAAGASSGETFEERARRLSERRSKVSTRSSEADARRRAVRAFEKSRLPHPRPTPVTDMQTVLSWLERHIESPGKRGGGKRGSGGASGGGAHGASPGAPGDGGGRGDPGSLQGMLSAWKTRASHKVEERRSAAAERAAAAADEASSPAAAEGGGPTEDTWEKQAKLEREVDALMRQRERERRERHAEARRLREEKRRANGGEPAWSESDESSSSDGGGDDDDASRLSRLTGPLAPWAVAAEDETIARFREQLPALERRKQEAKNECFAAERALRAVLGRKPTELERRDDRDWGRAAVAFKEADRTLFVARSLCSWDD